MWTITNRSEAGNEALILCIGMCVLSLVVYVLINLCGLGDSYLYVIVSMLSTVGIIMLSRLDIAMNASYGIANMKVYLGGVIVTNYTMKPLKGIESKER